jgi:hypothetical protein
VVAQARRYESVLNDLSIHAKASLNMLNTVATDADLAEEVGALNHFREARDRQAGFSKITAFRIIHLRLPAVGTRGRRAVATGEIRLCLDVSGVHAYGPSGHSIVPKSRNRYFLTDLSFANRDYPSPAAWLVDRRTDREVEHCDL